MRRQPDPDPRTQALARALRRAVVLPPALPYVPRDLAAEAQRAFDRAEAERLRGAPAAPPAPKAT